MKRIAVAGCGIAGATIAPILAESGFEVTIFEQAEQCRPVGAGIMLQPSGQQVLRQIGLLETIEAESQRLDGMTAQLTSGKLLVDLQFNRLSAESYALGVHRGRLFQCLFDKCQAAGVKVVNAAQVVSFDANRGVVQVTDGREFDRFDCVIAADGSRSKLRLNSRIRSKAKEYDYGAFWATGECDYQTGRLFQVVEGTHLLTGLLPTGMGQASFFWGLPISDWPALKSSDIHDWKEKVLGVFPQSSSLVEAITDFESVTFGTYRNVSMKRWHQDGVVFIGDAAHATSPHLGQGVNLALEDAFVLAEQMSEVRDFEKACQRYTSLRRGKLRYYQQLTKFLTPYFQSRGWLKGALRDIALPWLPSLPWVGSEMLRTLSGAKSGWIG